MEIGASRCGVNGAVFVFVCVILFFLASISGVGASSGSWPAPLKGLTDWPADSCLGRMG